MLLDQIILTCKLLIKDERSIASVYYLLIGEKAIQTVQDAHIYSIKQYYGIYKTLRKSDFDRKTINLLKQDLLKRTANNGISDYELTDKGEHWLEDNYSLQLTYFNGLKYEGISNEFLDRLFLLIQVLTNSKMGSKTYIPVIDKDPVTRWVKVAYQKLKLNTDGELHLLHKEMHSLLSELPEQEAEIFIDRLTSYKTYGLSIDQLSQKYNQDTDTLRLLIVGISHRMLDNITSEEEQYPFLFYATKDLSIKSNNKLTKSANITNNLLNNRTISEIAEMRNLTINTIYDHVVEIAIYNQDFPIGKYVNNEYLKEILTIIKQKKTFKLKVIKTEVNQDISYFQIRLVLATVDNISEIR